MKYLRLTPRLWVQCFRQNQLLPPLHPIKTNANKFQVEVKCHWQNPVFVAFLQNGFSLHNTKKVTNISPLLLRVITLPRTQGALCQVCFLYWKRKHKKLHCVFLLEYMHPAKPQLTSTSLLWFRGIFVHRKFCLKWHLRKPCIVKNTGLQWCSFFMV